MAKRNLLFVISMIMAIAMLTTAVLATEPNNEQTTVIDLSAGSYIIEADGEYTVSSYEGENTLTIKADAAVTLQGVNITAAADSSAINIESGNVTINVSADSTLIGGDNGAGIYVAEGASVTITGGKLIAKGNAGADDTSGAAGIGGTWANGNSGAITIDGATVDAYGYGVHGSGIGSGSGKVIGEIKIINSASVTAYGGYYADGAGTKLQSNYGKTDPEGGVGIGGGAKTVSTVADIAITDSTVSAYGGSKAAGIGANFWSSCGTITISGNSDVTAQGGSSSAGIGTSRAGDNGVSANIVISGGTVKATGGDYGAGIGGGYNNDSLGNGADESALPEIKVTISAGEITAVGGEGGAGIGGGYKTDNVDIDITGGAVFAKAGALVSGKTVENGGSASAIGTGANGSGKFENCPAVEVADAATITVTAYDGGKAAVEGMTNEDADKKDNIVVNTYVTGLSGSGTTEDPYIIGTVDELKWFAASVDGGNQYLDQVIVLTADIDLYAIDDDGERVTFNPIGENEQYFRGTFDGQGHTISNLYQSGWALEYDWYNYGSIGLFSYLWDATIKNLTIENAECFVEGGNVGGIAGSAWGDCTFENIEIINSTFATYNNRAAGIVGYTGGEGATFTFKDIIVDEDTVIAGLWGSFDSSLGGIMGSLGAESNAHFEDVEVACRLDAYNDVTASYKYYNYRMCGMLIGRITKNSGGTLVPEQVGVTLGDNVVVTFGDWANYHYIWDDSLSYGCQRIESGYQYGGIDVSKYPDAEITYQRFDKLFSGTQMGGYGVSEYTDANGNSVEVIIDIVTVNGKGFWTLQEALDAAVAESGNVTVEILDDLDLSFVDWRPVTVSAPNYPVVTVNGNNKTITGLNNMLFAGTWAGNSGLIINDLTIKDSVIVNDENDEQGTVGVGAFIGYPQASETITLNNCHLMNSTVKGGHWTGGLIGMAGGYNGNDGPVFMNLTITGCSVTDSIIEGKGSVGGVIGHGSCAAWTKVVIDDTEASGNTITSIGSSTNKAGSIMGTIGAAGQETTAAGQTKTGGSEVCATTKNNIVTSGGTTITTIYGRQGTSTGVLILTAGGNYENYPIEENVTYAMPAPDCSIAKTNKGTWSVLSSSNGDSDLSIWYLLLLQLRSQKFEITADATEGGMITPKGISEVKYDNDITYTITPDDGYAIADVVVDGESVGAVSEYTFESVKEAHTITAFFEELAWENPFGDVDEDDWFYEDIEYAYENGLMIGTSDDSFSPTEIVNRAMLVTVLWRLEGSPVVDSSIDFDDVPENEWYTDAVNWASANGIVNGYGDGAFGATNELTHEQVVAILNRYAVYKKWSENLDGNASDDYANSDWSENNVLWAEENGMFDGIGSDISNLTESADRAELAAYLRRFCEKFITE